MTRVTFLSHSGADSGAEQSTVTRLSRWPRSTDPPVLLLAQPGPIEDRARKADVECIVVALDSRVATTARGERYVWRLASTAAGLVRHSSKVRQELERRATEVVVAISLKSLVFGMLAARRAGATLVWSLHDRVHRDYFPSYVVPVLRWLVPRMVDGIVVNSRSTLATIRPGRTPVFIATPAINLDPRDFLPAGDEVRRVVMLGRLSPWKGQDLFLRAFANAFEGTGTEALLVGGALFGEDQYVEQLHRETERLGIADRVHFVGHVQDPWEWLVDADVLAHCSKIPEPFGIVVVQGMWARCAVVATKPGGPAEVIADGVDGLLVPCDDEPAMALALRRLREDGELRRRLSTAARETAKGYDAWASGPSLVTWLEELRHGRVTARTVTTPDGVERLR